MKWLLLLLLTGCSGFSYVECLAKGDRLGLSPERTAEACEVDRLDSLREKKKWKQLFLDLCVLQLV